MATATQEPDTRSVTVKPGLPEVGSEPQSYTCLDAYRGLIMLKPRFRGFFRITGQSTVGAELRAGLTMCLGKTFYVIIEVLGYRKWSFLLLVVGMNSIFIYFVSEVLHRWLDRAVGVFTFHYGFIGMLAPVAQATTALLVMWYLCYWSYQRRIFLKL